MGNCQAALKKGTVVIADDCNNDNSSPPSPPPLDVKVTETSIPSTIENDNFSIPIKIFTPIINNNNYNNKKKKKKIRAVVFFIHGGIFALGDMHSHPTISIALSKLGLIVVTASFRNGEEAPHETNVTTRDLMDVIHYCTTTYNELPFGLVGSSSGGFFAIQLSQSLLLSSLSSSNNNNNNNNNNDDRVVRPPSFCIPICPVADPYKRASYLRASISESQQQLEGRYNAVHTPEKSKFILEKQLSFWKSDEEMMKAAESIKSGGSSLSSSSITTTTNNNRVPTLLIIGSADKNVPFDVTNDVQGWATRTVVIGGYGHELCDEIVNGGGYYCYLPDIVRFLDYCLGGG
jgi:acetyl esterase/lipase